MKNLDETVTKEIKDVPLNVLYLSFHPGTPEDNKPVDASKYNLEKHIGEFAYNNGMIAYVNHNAEVNLIPIGALQRRAEELGQKLFFHRGKRVGDYVMKEIDRESIEKQLENAGYSKGYFFVPHSNDAGQWADKIVKDEKVIEVLMKQKAIENFYAEKGIKPTEVPENIMREFRPAGEGLNAGYKELIEEEGKMGVNNGTLAAVINGITYVAPYTEELETSLKELGFKKDSIFVPHSNDSRWINWMFPHKVKDISYKLEKREQTRIREENGIKYMG